MLKYGTKHVDIAIEKTIEMNKLFLALLFLLPFFAFSQINCNVQIYVDHTSAYKVGEQLNPNSTQLDFLILDSADIISYNPANFTFKLNKEAISRLQQLNLDFKVFTVVVNQERTLSGWFWSCGSSIGMRGFVAFNLNCNSSETLSINYCLPRLVKTRKDPRDYICPKPTVIGCWTNSFEENNRSQDSLLMRQCYSKNFPDSKFRFKIEFNKDNSCEWLELDGNDDPVMKQGSWVYDNDREKLTINYLDGRAVKEFTVLTIEKNLLVLKKELVVMQTIPIYNPKRLYSRDSLYNKLFPKEPINPYDTIIPYIRTNE